MDFNVFDRARRSSSPLQVDLLESYAQGRISRRRFVTRGTVLGLSVPFMGAVISACGSDDDSKSTPTTGAAPTTTNGSTVTGGSTTATTSASGGVAGGTIKMAIQSPAGPLDPQAMADLGSYGIVAQSFEYLCTLGANDIAPGLALSWEPNDDGSVWVFKLRESVKWHDGSAFSSADVVATMDRLVEGGNAGLDGVIEKGSAVATDPNTVTFNLTGPNGLFPYLVSVYNAQCCITPVSYVLGSTLDKTPAGTGAWKLQSYNSATGAKFVRNDAWWGGKTLLDGSEWLFSDDISTQVTGMLGGATDAIVQFSVLGGDALLADPDFNVLAARTATHREIWMKCDAGSFANKAIRQAFALSLDRELMIEQLFKGQADLGNDHPIAPVYPFFDDSVKQRTRDIAKAKQLLADAGATGLKANLSAPSLQEVPQLAELIKSNAAEAGIDITLNVEGTDTFYTKWCATYPCAGGVEFGIVDYGHRATPDTFLNAAYSTGGEWNASNYSSAEFDGAFKEYQAALDVDGHKAACKKLETIANEDTPVAIPYFYNYLSGHSKKFTGIRVSALGQVFLDTASKVE